MSCSDTLPVQPPFVLTDDRILFNYICSVELKCSNPWGPWDWWQPTKPRRTGDGRAVHPFPHFGNEHATTSHESVRGQWNCRSTGYSWRTATVFPHPHGRTGKNVILTGIAEPDHETACPFHHLVSMTHRFCMNAIRASATARNHKMSRPLNPRGTRIDQSVTRLSNTVIRPKKKNSGFFGAR